MSSKRDCFVIRRGEGAKSEVEARSVTAAPLATVHVLPTQLHPSPWWPKPGNMADRDPGAHGCGKQLAPHLTE